MKHRVFVYGTLRAGQPATHTLEGYTMFMVKGAKFDFPFIQRRDDRFLDVDAVVGNIIEVDDKELAALDKYEGVDRELYTREKVEVYNNDDETYMEVWAYVGGPQLAYPIIESGDWLAR